MALTKVRGNGVDSIQTLTIANGLTLTDGNIAVASGHGINFAADSSASGMASELFHDYEEGTFDPTMEHQGNSNLNTTKKSSNVGSYVKIGTTVYFQIILSISAVSGGDSSNLQVGNMPFTSKSISTNGYGGATVTYTAWNTVDPIAAVVLTNSDDMRLYTAALQPALGNQLQANSYIVLHGQYETAS